MQYTEQSLEPRPIHLVFIALKNLFPVIFILDQEKIVRGEVQANIQEAQLMREFLAQAKKALNFVSGVIDLMECKLPPEAEPEPELEPPPKKKKKSH